MESKDPEGKNVSYSINFAQSQADLVDPNFYDTDNNYFLLPNLKEGVWYWQVKATDADGKSVKSPVWNFTINGEGLPQPEDPADIPPDPSLIVSSVQDTSFTLKWEKYKDPQNPSNEINYTIDVYEAGETGAQRQDRGYYLARTDPATTVSTTDTTHTFNDMDNSTKYDWTIIARNNASQTSVVGSSDVKTGNGFPTAPELLGPENNATDVATDVTLSWTASEDPDEDPIRYYVYLDTVKNTNRTMTVEGIETTQYTPEDIKQGQTYYWFILVKDNNGAATRTAIQIFTTVSPEIAYPTNPTPEDDATGISPVPDTTLEWEHNQKEDDNYQYTLYFGKDPRNLTEEARGINQTSYTIEDYLEQDTRYYWQVQVANTDTDKSVRGPQWQFKTKTLAPPEQIEAKTNTEGTQIELVYDKAMADPSGKHEQYTVEKTSANSQRSTEIPTSRIEIKPGTQKACLLSLEEHIGDEAQLTIAYTMGNIRAVDGSHLASYEATKVVNRVPGEAPKCIEATMTTDGQTIELGFDKPMQAPTVSEHEQFGVLVNGYVNETTRAVIKANNESVILLELEHPVGQNNQVHVSYTKGTIQSENGSLLESFQNRRVDISQLNTIRVRKGINWNYSTIQEAIDGADDGAIITVATGTYSEAINLGEKNLHIQTEDPENVTVRDQTIIDAQGQKAPAVTIHQGQDNTTIIEGFTIQGDNAVQAPTRIVRPSAIDIKAAPIIRYNKITNCKGNNGGGIKIETIMTAASRIGAKAIIANNLIQTNSATKGGGIYLSSHSQAAIYANTIKDNEATDAGGGIYIEANATVYNADDAAWKRYNSPSAPVTFTENTTNHNNTYENNATGAIVFEGQQTPAGTVILRPESGTEQDLVTLNIDYDIGREFYEASLTINVPTGFEITNQASILYGDTEKEAAEYTYNQQNITLTDLTLESGKITLKLAEQEIPDGVNAESQVRDISYTFSAQSDADGDQNAWSASTADTADFVSEPLSTNTDFLLNGDNPQYIQYNETGSATSLKVGSETTVATVLASIESADGSEQAYTIKNAENANLDATVELTQSATLVVISEHGESHSAEYAIVVNPTAFVRLENNAESTGQRLASNISWHDTIQDGVDAANNGSTLTVWPGVYREAVELGNKGLHLKSIAPEDETVRNQTIIDAGNSYNAPTVKIGETIQSSERGEITQTVIEGFTIKGYNPPQTQTRTLETPAVHILQTTPILRYNKITNGTGTNGGGIKVETMETAASLIGAKAIIANNLIQTNSATKGGGIYLSSHSEAAIYANTIKDNEATDAGGGIYIEANATVYNADDTTWKRYNSPSAPETFTENTTNHNNTYENNANGDIVFEEQQTPSGTLSLRPESGTEHSMVTLNIDYTIGREFYGASLTIDVPTGFEITDNASILYGETEKEAVEYIYNQQNITLTDLTLETGTVTLRLTEQEIPTGVQVSQLRDVNYTFKAQSDADGNASAWNVSDTSEAVFTSVFVSSDTDFKLKESVDYLNITDTPTKVYYLRDTTVGSLTSKLEASDGSPQTYTVKTSSGNLNPEDTLPGQATLTVLAEDGTTKDFGIYSADFKLSVETEKSLHRTLQEAVDAADTSNPNLITICTDTVNEGAEVVIDSGREITIKPQEGKRSVTTINGNGTNRAFHLSNGASVTFSDLDITNCKATGNNNGGAIFAESIAALSFERCQIISNEATSGGGVYATDTAKLIFDNTIIGTNTATYDGGGIYINSDSDFTLKNSTITNNETLENNWGNWPFGGSGIMAFGNNIQVNIINAFISQNKANESGVGGGILIDGDSNAFLSITSSRIEDNTGYNGGGIYVSNASLVVTDSNIASNTTDEQGAGVYSFGSNVEISDSNISSNSVLSWSAGGGCYFSNTVSTITNTTVSDNRAFTSSGTSGGGGGIMVYNSLFTTSDSTYTSNETSESGGAIYSEYNEHEYDPADYSQKTVSDIQNCFISANTAEEIGGGIYSAASTSTITDSEITANEANAGGGGIGSNYNNTIIERCLIDSNTSNGDSGGGGVFLNGLSLSNTYETSISNSTITNNNANNTDAYGGGIHTKDASVMIANSTIENNSSYAGGGVANYSKDYDSHTTIKNSVVSSNQATDEGGGIYSMNYNEYSGQENESHLTVTDSLIALNTSNVNGGGILTGGSHMVVENATVTFNSAVQNGGGIGMRSWYDISVATITSSDILSNEADKGAGIHISEGSNSPITTTIYSNEINNNTAVNNGGGIYVVYTGSPAIYNSTGDPWLEFDCPASDTADVEQNTTNINTYDGNTAAGNDTTIGADIDFVEY